MQNKDIVKLLKLTSSLMELHDENPFKVKSFSVASYYLDNVKTELAKMSVEELSQLQGVGKGLASKIYQLTQEKTFADLQLLLDATPAGVMEMLDIKGIGPKKVRLIWKDLNIITIDDLNTACKDGKVATLKGFGDKIQEEILEYLDFKKLSKGKFYYADVEEIAFAVEKALKIELNTEQILIAGDFRRKLEIIDKLQFLIGSDDPISIFSKIDDMTGLVKNQQMSSPFIWRGIINETEIKTEIKVFPEKEFVSQAYLHTASKAHLNSNFSLVSEESSVVTNLFSILKQKKFTSENELFQHLNWQFIEPELREGDFEIEAAQAQTLPKLITDQDLKGIFHNHTTYSDGEHTLEEMAVFCKNLGYQYLGISDHSKSATYAKGLKEDAVFKQQKEIDDLNIKLAPFKIYKGIESDILGDGSLDYDESVLKTFDYIVASVHSGMKMDIQRATQRLIKAIENPYTTMLGHPTGRLLLRRQGYPLHFPSIIDACAANRVIIEINANPWRLDLDWRWVHYALDKGVMLSINPDAHEVNGYADMHFGVCVARKGGLTSEMCFNAKTLDEVEKYFLNRKKF